MKESIQVQVKDIVSPNLGGMRPMQFVQTSYPTFLAEVALAGKENHDYVVHFYAPRVFWEEKFGGWNDSLEKTLRAYLKELFPHHLSEMAQSFFGATYPQLRAAFTPENHSWWFRANACANVFVPEDRIQLFFDRLNTELLRYLPPPFQTKDEGAST